MESMESETPDSVPQREGDDSTSNSPGGFEEGVEDADPDAGAGVEHRSEVTARSDDGGAPDGYEGGVEDPPDIAGEGEPGTEGDAPSEQEAQISEAWRGIDGLQPDQWADASQEERLATLQQAEDAAASIQGRDPMPVGVDSDVDDDVYGYYDGDRIAIGEYSLNNHDVSDVANTVAHEGRHAYQDYAVEHPGFHANDDEVQSWKENMEPGNYISPEEDPEGYRDQPIERDAWGYGDRVTAGVYGARGL